MTINTHQGTWGMKKLVRLQSIVVLSGIVLMIIKLIAFLITSSNVILTDALESIVNVIAGAFAFYSLRLSSKPRDRDHPFGHGKIEFISASIEGTLICIAGIVMINKAVYNLLFPHSVSEIEIGIYITGGAGIVNFIMGQILLVQGRKHNHISMEADGKHLLSDFYSTVGMIFGLIALMITGLIWIDNALTIVFGSIISWTGISILRKAIPGIMDEADNKLLSHIILSLQQNRQDNWIDLHNLRVIKYGSVYHLECHITLPWYFNIRQGHDEMKKIEALFRKNFGERAEVIIHSDPCRENSCSICTLSSCTVRLHEFVKQVDWTPDNVIEDRQHDGN